MASVKKPTNVRLPKKTKVKTSNPKQTGNAKPVR
jgi:hypothetical protein